MAINEFKGNIQVQPSAISIFQELMKVGQLHFALKSHKLILYLMWK